ncbi:sensor histidine kinase [Nocardiopsis sp. MG754419]|uniref:sensor histidine kinase n=1 Tax=Nocardiopsis sp. MG754419 TaxID=2259865 RepID=UPI001BAC868C|nr:histidine kinase [Nocardiopsis sp. MG754419]MBR8742912.1 sensor histidine kinase [Nocardiopsis sp. MG754419]
MNGWLREHKDGVAALARHNGKWWWDRRFRLADWSFAVFTLPFSGVTMVAGTSGGVLGLLSGPVEVITELLAPWAWMLVVGLLIYFVPGLLASATMLWRRSAPRWLLLAGLLMLVLYGNPIPLMVGLYSYPAYFSDRRTLTGWFALACLANALIFNVAVISFVMTAIPFLVVPTIAGLWIGTRRELIVRLKERAERLEREQHMMADQAIAAERTRIAREMHDVVAHRVSLMVLHAGGLEVSASDERTGEAAGLIRTTGREALAELRGILGVLRDDEGEAAPTAPQPVLGDLERLFGEWRGAGMDVRLRETGAALDLPVSTQRTAFRVVQEALTNAAKHATGATVHVWVHHTSTHLEVEVANEAAPGPVNPPPRSGYGLTGLRERVQLAGGRIGSGPCPEGGWRLRAILPVHEDDEPTDADEGARNDTPPHGPEEEEASTRDPHDPGR